MFDFADTEDESLSTLEVHTVENGHDADREDEGEGACSNGPLTPSKQGDISDIPEVNLETPKTSDVDDDTLGLSELPDTTPTCTPTAAQESTSLLHDTELTSTGAFQVFCSSGPVYKLLNANTAKIIPS